MSDYSGVLGDGVLGNFTLGDDPSSGTFAFGQAQATILAQKFGQAQANILRIYQSYGQAQSDIKQVYYGFVQAQADITHTYQGYGQAQANILGWVFGQSQGDIKQTYFGFAQAQAKIDAPSVGSYGFAQAQAFICWLDTFTRTTSYGLGSDYTWEEFDASFDVQEDSTYHVNGTKIVNSPENFDFDSYSINRTIPAVGTVQFDFTTASAFSDFPYVVVVFGSDYNTGRLSLAIAANEGDWFLWGDWNANSLPNYSVTIGTSKTYTVKMSYDATGKFARKVWETGQSEPDWMVSGILPDFVLETTAWLDLYFGGDILSVDNLKFCAPEAFALMYQGYAQAGALIHRYEGYGQSQGQITNTTANGLVQAYINFESIEVINDNFNRTTRFGLGKPYYRWTDQERIGASVDHPAASLIKLDGTQLSVPEGEYETQHIGLTSRVIGRIQFDFTITDSSDVSGLLFHFIGKDTFDFIFYPWPFGTPDQIFLGAPTDNGINPPVPNSGSVLSQSSYTAGTKYTILVRRSISNQYQIYFANTNINADTNFLSAGSAVIVNTYTPTNHLLELSGPSSGIKFDNLVILPPQGMAAVRAKIKVQTNKHAQTQAKIKATYRGWSQAQAEITTTWRMGQAQADINQIYYGWGQAQAKIFAAGVNTLEKMAQAQARIVNTTANGQAQARIGSFWEFAQAQAYMVKFRGNMRGQARARIKIFRWVWAQAQAYIKPSLSFGQSQGYISAFGSSGLGQASADILQTLKSYGQAQAQIQYTLVTGQAQAQISSIKNFVCGQAAARISRISGFGQTQAKIKSAANRCAQTQAQIVSYINKCGQAQAYISRTIRHGTAQAFIDQPAAGNLVKFNNYLLPGYLQEENLVSEMGINISDNIYGEAYNEYIGLQNKQLSIRMKVVQATYAAAKEKVLLAGTLLRSSKDWTRLTVIDTTKYYLVKTPSIKTGQQAGQSERQVDYTVDFEVKPWKYGDLHSLVGTTLLDTDNVDRSFENGTWTPATVILTGNNITVSGYTPTESFTGFISVSGAVNNIEIDTENYTALIGGQENSYLLNYDYKLMISPGRTLFAITGATSAEIIYQDRWEI